MSGPLLKLLNTVRLLACRRLPGLVLAGLDDRRTFSGHKELKSTITQQDQKHTGRRLKITPRLL